MLIFQYISRLLLLGVNSYIQVLIAPNDHRFLDMFWISIKQLERKLVLKKTYNHNPADPNHSTSVRELPVAINGIEISRTTVVVCGQVPIQFSTYVTGLITGLMELVQVT